MIRKYLILGRQILLSSANLEDEKKKTMDLLMPLNVYWKVDRLMRKADLAITSKEPTVVLNSIYRELFEVVAPCAVSEQDRKWLYASAQGNPPPKR